MTVDDLIERLRELSEGHGCGDLPLAFCPLPNAQYGYMEGAEYAENEPDFYSGKRCVLISYVPR